MANKEKILEGLQTIVTDLAQQADGHAIQSRVFCSQGFDKLGEKYAEHAAEERGYVDQCVDRILDLSGEERASMTVDGLLRMYSEKKKEGLDNDRMLFS